MIIEGICNLFFGLIRALISMISVTPDFVVPSWLLDFSSLIGRALFFFPVDVWSVVMGSFLFWTNIHMWYAFIEWAYKKIPGIN